MDSASGSSSRNSDSETEIYSDIVYLDGVESEVIERGLETDPRGKVWLWDCVITLYLFKRC